MNDAHFVVISLRLSSGGGHQRRHGGAEKSNKNSSSPWLRRPCGVNKAVGSLSILLVAVASSIVRRRADGGSLPLVVVAVVSFLCGARRLLVCWWSRPLVVLVFVAVVPFPVRHLLIELFSSCCHCHCHCRFSLLFCRHDVKAVPLPSRAGGPELRVRWLSSVFRWMELLRPGQPGWVLDMTPRG